jgi:hypothetical protein
MDAQKLTGLDRACTCDVAKGLGGYISAEIQDWKLENRKSKLEKAAPRAIDYRPQGI